ncbi:cytochrome P450 [Sphaerimonospora mesophila]|uniref:cytochrome P450 n=1 Tax=Sphaerimonospora mesophila TaxID=37483 RepID=UPI000A75E95B
MTATEETTKHDVIDRLTTTFDYHDPEYTPETAEIINRVIRDRTPVAYSPAHGGMWVLSRYEDVKAALRDHETFSSAEGVHFPRAKGMPPFTPIDFDPPEQARIRALMAPPMKKKAIRDLESRVRALAAELIPPIVERGHGDLVAELSQPFAISALGLALGLSDETQHEIRAMTNTMWRYLSTEPDASRFWGQYQPILAGEIRRARENPGDHYLSWLANVRVDGEFLSDDLLCSIMVSYCVAGHANTMNTVNRVLWCLGKDVDLQYRVRREPKLLTQLPDEALRRWCPTDRFTRVTTRDVTIRDITIPKGSRVVLIFDSANRDPEQFPDPEEFSVDRANSHLHLTYGHGIHRCLGEHFARMEFKVLLSEIARHPVFRLTEEPPVHFDNGRHIIFDRLMVRFGETGGPYGETGLQADASPTG